jgi:hypothetical protein
LFQRGELKLEGAWSDLLDPAEAEAWIKGLEAIDWNVFVEGPPNGQSDPKHVLMYLARYLTGGPIADSRLISHEGDKVTFWARPKTDQPDRRKGTRKSPEPFKLECVELVRRWTMHILPKGFTKTRRYGGFSGANCAAYLERCRQLLNFQPPEAPSAPTVVSPKEPVSLKCLRCQCDLTLIQATPRPSWRDVFDKYYTIPGSYSPMWHFNFHFPKPASGSTRPWQPDG